jgi:hypothetical protein
MTMWQRNMLVIAACLLCGASSTWAQDANHNGLSSLTPISVSYVTGIASAEHDSIAPGSIQDEVRQSDHRLMGTLVGGLAGGLLAVALVRLNAGECSAVDAHVSCGAVYTGWFLAGAVPGAFIGYHVGRSIR